MIVADHLYGRVSIPEWLLPIVNTPEVQRLREVRLINISSQSCPALSDTRRFTHTIGVVTLAGRLGERVAEVWSPKAARTLQVAALIHDVATPAFGHLFEYLFSAIRGWDHESFVKNVIDGTYRPEKRYHQIYYGNSLRLHEVLVRLGFDPNEVTGLVRGEGSLGQVLNGSIDIDNIDNVYRMSSLLGIPCNSRDAIDLVDAIQPTSTGILFHETGEELIARWRQLRRKVYTFLAFDEATLSAQAMMTDCLTRALSDGVLNEEHWFFTDEQLMRFLLDKDETKDIIMRLATADLYQTVFMGWYSSSDPSRDLRTPSNRAALSSAMQDLTRLPCSPYVFHDRGTFSKNLVVDLRGQSAQPAQKAVDAPSRSVIVGVFTPRHISRSAASKLHSPIREALRQFGLSKEKSIPFKEQEEHGASEFSGQAELPL